MKKQLAMLTAGLAICLLLAACTPKQVAEAPAEPDSTPGVIIGEQTSRADVQTPTESEISLQTAVAEGSYDEVCSYQISYPQADNAHSALNPLFEEDLAYLKNECSGTVFETASERSCVAAVEGEYACTQDAGVLTVDYTLNVNYSDTDTATCLNYLTQYDLQTCTRLEALS